MATQNKITEVIAAIKTLYPYYAKESDVATLVKLWEISLRAYPDEVVEVALLKSIQKCKTPPTPADIIEQINGMIESTEETEEEIWSKFTQALRKVRNELNYIQYPLFGETSEDARKRVEVIWDNLPKRAKQYIGTKSELMRMASDYTDDDLKFEKTRFLKTLPTLKKREEYTELRLLLGDERLLLGE